MVITKSQYQRGLTPVIKIASLYYPKNTLLRPHLGSGATKALEDALRLLTCETWAEWGKACQQKAAHPVINGTSINRSAKNSPSSTSQTQEQPISREEKPHSSPPKFEAAQQIIGGEFLRKYVTKTCLIYIKLRIQQCS